MYLGSFILNKLNNVKSITFFLVLSFGPGSSIATTIGEIENKQLIETQSVETQPLAELQQVEKIITAKEIVVEFQFILLEVMKQGKNLDFQARCKLLEVAVLNSHDVKKSLRTIVGSKEWGRFSDEQKNKLTIAFTNFIVSTYASNFNEFSDESFEYISEHTTKKGNIIIRSVLNIPTGNRNKVTFDYALKKNIDGWRIYNIAADGVSDLATRRSEYRRILAKEDGFNSLIAIINKKIDNYAKQ